MSKQTTLKISDKFRNINKELEEYRDFTVKQRLLDIAETAISLSPVDTGAYVTSHSFKTNTSSRGRGKTSHGKPKGQSVEAKRSEGLDNLVSDINNLDLGDKEKITLRNDSPHAQIVEEGGPNWTKPAYKVYAQIRNIYG